jgi:hypothetical protein
MNFNDALERALGQARDMQRQAGAAVNEAAEAMKPHIEKSLAEARSLQQTLSRHTTESGDMTAEQTQMALGHLSDFMRLGSEAMRESVEQARETAKKMADQSRKVVDSMQSAVNRREAGSGSEKE